MPKKSKSRLVEQQYITRARELQSKLPNKTKRTPWADFFKSGRGATVEASIPKSSIHSIVYSYGKKLGKRFKCSYEENDGVTLVTLLHVGTRD